MLISHCLSCFTSFWFYPVHHFELCVFWTVWFLPVMGSSFLFTVNVEVSPKSMANTLMSFTIHLSSSVLLSAIICLSGFLMLLQYFWTFKYSFWPSLLLWLLKINKLKSRTPMWLYLEIQDEYLRFAEIMFYSGCYNRNFITIL